MTPLVVPGPYSDVWTATAGSRRGEHQLHIELASDLVLRLQRDRAEEPRPLDRLGTLAGGQGRRGCRHEQARALSVVLGRRPDDRALFHREGAQGSLIVAPTRDQGALPFLLLRGQGDRSGAGSAEEHPAASHTDDQQHRDGDRGRPPVHAQQWEDARGDVVRGCVVGSRPRRKRRLRIRYLGGMCALALGSGVREIDRGSSSRLRRGGGHGIDG